MKGYLVGLGLSMALSIWCLLGAYHYGGLEGVGLMIIILIPGLSGLYFSTKVKSQKIRWLFLVINYLLATAYNVFQFLELILHFFSNR